MNFKRYLKGNQAPIAASRLKSSIKWFEICFCEGYLAGKAQKVVVFPVFHFSETLVQRAYQPNGLIQTVVNRQKPVFPDISNQ